MPEEVSFLVWRELVQLRNFRAAPSIVVCPNSTMAEASITGDLLLECLYCHSPLLLCNMLVYFCQAILKKYRILYFFNSSCQRNQCKTRKCSGPFIIIMVFHNFNCYHKSLFCLKLQKGTKYLQRICNMYKM